MADAIYDGLIARGFNPAQAAALAGNIKAESKGNPTAWNAKEGAGGLMQWRLDRLDNLLAYAKATGRKASDTDAQLDFLVQEMSGEYGNEAENAAAFLAAQDPAAATVALKPYIRYAPGSENERLQYTLAYAKPNKAEVLNQWATAPEGDATMAENKAMAMSRGDLLKQWNVGGGTGTTKKVSPDRAKLLEQWGGDDKKATPGAFGDNPMAPEMPADAETGYQPSMVPWLDPINAAANSFVEAIPVVGPALNDFGQNVDAAFASMVEGKPVTPEERAKINAAEKAEFPAASLAGTVGGTVLPLAALGATQAGGRLLGMSGGLAERMGMGLLSGGTISAADTVARGGTGEQAVQNALLGGGVGGVAPVVGKVIRGAWDAFKGPNAAQAFAKALDADAIAPGQVNALIGAKGPGAVAADLGPNMQQLAGGLAAVPGRPQSIVKNALMARAANAGNRLTADVAENLGEGEGLRRITSQIIADQKKIADPLYAAVREVPLPIDGDFKFVLQTPMGQDAFRQAAKLAANDGMKVNGLTVGLVDYAKRALDDIAGTAFRNGENNVGRQATDLANRLKGAADTAEPGYAAAREAFAGPAKVLDAIEEGKSVFTRATSPDDLKALMSDMTASEKEGLLLGAQAAVQQMIGNARTDAAGVKAAFASDFAKEKLGMLIGKDAADNIAKAIAREAEFAATSNVAYGNSLTAAREEMKKLVSPETANLPKAQTWESLLFAGLEKARNALTAQYRSKQNVKLANMLVGGPASGKTLAKVGKVGAKNALIAPASVPLLDKNASGDRNMLLWAKPKPVQITVGY